MNILKKINKMRLERKWSVYRLSVESGIPQSTITNMFNRETLPSIPTLKNICDAFGITMSEFFREENDNSQNTQKEGELLALFNQLTAQEQDGLLILLRKIAEK
jgi:transcriptional regulator with XRE-family HTH domain